jgi:hypothetical protein
VPGGQAATPTAGLEFALERHRAADQSVYRCEEAHIVHSPRTQASQPKPTLATAIRTRCRVNFLAIAAFAPAEALSGLSQREPRPSVRHSQFPRISGLSLFFRCLRLPTEREAPREPRTRRGLRPLQLGCGLGVLGHQDGVWAIEVTRPLSRVPWLIRSRAWAISEIGE